jgi:hypothetical protein
MNPLWIFTVIAVLISALVLFTACRRAGSRGPMQGLTQEYLDYAANYRFMNGAAKETFLMVQYATQIGVTPFKDDPDNAKCNYVISQSDPYNRHRLLSSNSP